MTADSDDLVRTLRAKLSGGPGDKHPHGQRPLSYNCLAQMYKTCVQCSA